MHDSHIEFCHIYNDQEFGEEQAASIEILNKVKNELAKNKESFITSILIDEINITKQIWNIEYLLKKTELFGATPDIISFEGRFKEIAEKIIELIPKEYKRIIHFKKDGKDVVFFNDGKVQFPVKDIYPDHVRYKCVSLSCAWLLCKLGIMEFPIDSVLKIGNVNNLKSRRIITILPQKFKDVEEKVLKIISSIGLERESERIEYIFY